MFNSYVNLFSKCIIEPTTSTNNGNLTYPDIVDEKNAGVIVAPISYRVKVLKRQGSK
jgi:hypothetical protein